MSVFGDIARYMDDRRGRRRDQRNFEDAMRQREVTALEKIAASVTANSMVYRREYSRAELAEKGIVAPQILKG